jgi:1-acyl-sn-glycerol-3-phosphate acyltransferase
MKIVRNIPFGLWFYGVLFTLRPLQKKIRALKNSGNIQEERRYIREAEDRWGKALINQIGIDLRVRQLADLPDGPVVFVSNHQSYLDIPVFFVGIQDRQVGFIAKTDLGKIPGLGPWIKDVRSLFIEREDTRGALKVFEEGARLLRDGFSLTIFPEGTRSKGPSMGEFKKGSLRLASKAGVPVVPVTLNGTYRCYEEKGYLQPATVDFVIHPAIETAGLSKQEASVLTEQVQQIIATQLEELQKSSVE